MVEPKDVSIPQVGKAAAKGIKTAEQLDKILDDGDKLANKLSEAQKKIDELESQVEDSPEQEEVESEDTSGGNGNEPPPLHQHGQEWGLNDAETRFQQDLATGKGFQTVSGVSRYWAQEEAKKTMAPYATRLEKAEAALEELKTLDSWAAQTEEAIELLGEEFMEENKDDIHKFMKKRGDKPLKDNELLTMLMKRKIESEKAGKGTVADEIAKAKGEKSFTEGESDAPARSGYSLKKMTAKEMEEVLPVGNVNKPIEEGE